MPQALLSVLAPSLDMAQVTDFSTGFVLSAMALPLVALAGVVGAYLNAKGVFGVPTIGVIAYNIVLCAYLALVATSHAGVLGLALAILVAVTLRLAMHLLAAPEFVRPRAEPGPVPTNGWALSGPALARRFAIGVATSGLVFAVPILFRAVHAAKGDGALTLFNFAQKMFELPSGILIAPVVLVMLPKLSGLARAGESDTSPDFDRTFAVALVASVSIATSAALVGILFADPLAALLFLHGAMVPADVGQIATLAVTFLLGLPFLAAQQVAAAALNATGRPQSVAISAAFALGFALVASFALGAAWPEGGLAPALGVVLFQMALAALNLRALPCLRREAATVIQSVLWMILRSALAITPFVGIVAVWGEGMGRWSGTALATAAFAVLLVANLSDIRPLRRLRAGMV